MSRCTPLRAARRSIKRRTESWCCGLPTSRLRKGERDIGQVILPDFFLERKTMNTHRDSWLSRNRWILIVVGVPILAGAWWAFRPEKLFINQKVIEAAPAALSAEPEALYTGKLEGKVHPTSGRAI